MPLRIRLLFASLSLSLFFVAAVPLYTELSRRRDIWWTPPTMLVPLAESKDRVEIYARGRPLAALLEAGQLRIVQDASLGILAASDVGLRFNNWDRVRVVEAEADIARCQDAQASVLYNPELSSLEQSRERSATRIDLHPILALRERNEHGRRRPPDVPAPREFRVERDGGNKE